MAGSVALLLSFLAIFLPLQRVRTRRAPWTLANSRKWLHPAQLAQMVTAHLGPVMPWLAIGVLAGFAVKVPLMPFHTWLPAATLRRLRRDHAAYRRHVEDGRLRPARIAIPLFGPQIAPCARRCRSCRRHRRHGRVGRCRANRSQARLRLLLDQSPGLLPAGHLRARGSRSRSGAAGQSGRGAQRRHPADVQPRAHRCRALLVRLDDSISLWRFAWHQRVRRFSQARAGLRGTMGIALFSSSVCRASMVLSASSLSFGEFFRWRGRATVSVLGLLVTAVVILTVIQKVFSGPVPERWAAFPTCITANVWLSRPSSVSCFCSALCPSSS